MKERIQKVLAAAGVESRRHIEEMIRQGRVTVNGKVMVDLPILIDPQKDKIKVDDEPVRLKVEKEELVYVLMNKPKNVFTTNVAQGEQLRAIDLLPPGFPRVFPVGRLDHESKGLLILTNDGELTHQLTHAKFGVPKTYKVTCDGYVDQATIDELQEGVWLADPHKGGFKTGRSRAKVVKRTRDKTILELTLREGRNRQIRRMLAKTGHKVRELTRVSMGPLTLAKLEPGKFRMLTPREVKELKGFPQKMQKLREERMKQKKPK
jgi:pseudouridine synthase